MMVQLPPLPEIETPWSPNIRNAFLHLNTIYSTASAYLETGSVEPHRLDKYAAAVVGDAFPLLLLLDESAEEENLSIRWLEKCPICMWKFLFSLMRILNGPEESMSNFQPNS